MDISPVEEALSGPGYELNGKFSTVVILVE